MNQQLVKFIELCLVDGVISEKEREVIFRKSKELGVPDDECQIILEGLSGQHNKKSKKSEKKDVDKNIDIKESYIDLETPQNWMANLNKVNKSVEDFLNSENEKIKTFVSSGDFKSSLQKSPFVFEKNTLDNMINQPRHEGFFSKTGFLSFTVGGSASSTLEWEVRDQIENILSNEEFIGYLPFHIYMVDETELNESIEHQSKYNVGDKDYWENWCFSVFTNKGIHTFQRIDETYAMYKTNRTGFVTYESLKEMYDKNKVEPVDGYDEPPIAYARFLLLHSGGFSPLILDLKLNFNDNMFMEKVSSCNFNKDGDLTALMRIHNFISRSVNEHNAGLDKIKGFEVYNTNKILNDKTLLSGFSNLKKLEGLIAYHKEFLLFTTNLLMLRDSLLNCFIKSEAASAKKIILKCEDLGVLKTKFERDLLNSLGEIAGQLSQLNKNMVSFSETLGGHLQSIGDKLEAQGRKLSEISGQLTYNNLISTINTYQVWKINKNRKPLS